MALVYNNAIRRDHTMLIFNLQQLVGWASRLIAELYMTSEE